MVRAGSLVWGLDGIYAFGIKSNKRANEEMPGGEKGRGH